MPLTWIAVKERCKHWFDFSARRRALYARWEEQASAGNEEAKYKLLMLYPDSKEEFYPLAFKWTMNVAKEGADCGVLMQAAQMLEAGHGTVKDERRALVWFERALSLHILRGKNSALSAGTSNYIQEKIQTLRAKVGRE